MTKLWYYLLAGLHFIFRNDEYLKLGGKARSNQWPKVRKEFLKKHPCCAVCGGDTDIDVHHEIPFHKDPVLELEESNLITLCTPHHFLVGHLMSWRSYNTSVRSDASDWKLKINNRP